MQGKTVLFVGAGRHQRRAILRAQELGVRVVAVDRNVEAPGMYDADVAEAIDYVSPMVVDVSSGVESAPGIKDQKLVRAFASAARGNGAAA